ncbi:DUF4340 domain-containing protein [Luteolibacter algae]|uniref:DUF4340 domain-containing protein n=1 Tax=Luteolibacter algae TaxID=454151 RepID=A0ABW5D371_9BACT
MRSLFFTLLLLIIATVLGGFATWQLKEGSLERILGTPPTDIGEKIYPDFQPEKVARIIITTGQQTARFVKSETGWEATSPWTDRMDARAALAILTFANTTSVEDRAPRDDLDPSLIGLDTGNSQVRLENEDGESLAFFRLGRRTPWLNLPEGENPQPIPTTYLLPLESGRKTHVYAATGDILPLFKDGFKFLRDHRPFYFNPLALQKIRIRTSQGELTLGRETAQSPWRIVKPLELPTNPAAVKKLLEGLFELQATKLSDRSDVTLPSSDTAMENSQIALLPFGAEKETVLEIFPPDSSDSRETQAIISDRPGTLFTLPLKVEQNLISISDLPLTVNDLRDPTLSNLNIASIRGIAIEPSTSPLILISRQPPSPWMATIAGREEPANEQRLYELLKAITDTRAVAFETDAAPEDLSPWGLDKPILSLTFLAENNQTLGIAFGLDTRGNLFAKRKDSATIMRLENSFLEKIAVRPHEWRHARLWSVNRVDLKTLIRDADGQPPLKLRYDFLGETWKAYQSGQEVTSNLDPARANFLLGLLENIEVSQWLGPNDEDALQALDSPLLTFVLTENTVDEFGDPTGEKSQTLSLAVDPKSRNVYGRLSGESSLFTLAPELFLKLSISLLDNE